MIGKLQGIVEHIDNDFIILMTGGVGYKVFTSNHYTRGETISMWIETIVREDSFRLFGFNTLSQQDLFNQLTGVSGVGPKVALSILSSLKPDVLLSAIATGDVKTISSANGVGKKMAEKIIVELKGKTGSVAFDMASNSNVLTDLLAALESLGYKRIEIIEVAQQLVDKNPTATVETLIPMILKILSGK